MPMRHTHRQRGCRINTLLQPPVRAHPHRRPHQRREGHQPRRLQSQNGGTLHLTEPQHPIGQQIARLPLPLIPIPTRVCPTSARMQVDNRAIHRLLMLRNQEPVIPCHAKRHRHRAIVRLHLYMRDALLPINADLPCAISLPCFQRRLLGIQSPQHFQVRCILQIGQERGSVLQQMIFRCIVVLCHDRSIIPRFVRFARHMLGVRR